MRKRKDKKMLSKAKTKIVIDKKNLTPEQLARVERALHHRTKLLNTRITEEDDERFHKAAEKLDMNYTEFVEKALRDLSDKVLGK